MNSKRAFKYGEFLIYNVVEIIDKNQKNKSVWAMKPTYINSHYFFSYIFKRGHGIFINVKVRPDCKHT